MEIRLFYRIDVRIVANYDQVRYLTQCWVQVGALPFMRRKKRRRRRRRRRRVALRMMSRTNLPAREVHVSVGHITHLLRSPWIMDGDPRLLSIVSDCMSSITLSSFPQLHLTLPQCYPVSKDS
jgi:hypothetical protein